MFTKKTITRNRVKMAVMTRKNGESMSSPKIRVDVTNVPVGKIIAFHAGVHDRSRCNARSTIAQKETISQTAPRPVINNARSWHATCSGAAASAVKNVPWLYSANLPPVFAAAPRSCNAAAVWPIGPTRMKMVGVCAGAGQPCARSW